MIERSGLCHFKALNLLFLNTVLNMACSDCYGRYCTMNINYSYITKAYDRHLPYPRVMCHITMIINYSYITKADDHHPPYPSVMCHITMIFYYKVSIGYSGLGCFGLVG